MNNILLIYAFLLLLCIVEDIHRELFFLDIKVTIAETSTEILWKFVYLTMFEKGQILRKIWICLNNPFWTNQLLKININKKKFSPQSEPHTAKLCLSVVLRILGEIQRELFFLDIKVTISETSTEIRRNYVFLTLFDRGKSRGKFGFV